MRMREGRTKRGWWAKHPAPHMAFNSEGLLGVWAMSGLGAREEAGILLAF